MSTEPVPYPAAGNENASPQESLPVWKHTTAVRAVILDRDGTIIAERNYLHDPDEVELLPGAVEGLRILQQRGFKLFVATNQGGVGRGYFTLNDMHAVNKRMDTLLRAGGVALDAVYYCPHAPDAQCGCRKPAPGMLRQIALEYAVAPETSFVIGDKDCDILLGSQVGMRTVLVRTGYGRKTEKKGISHPSYKADTLYEAAQWIVNEDEGQHHA